MREYYRVSVVLLKHIRIRLYVSAWDL